MIFIAFPFKQRGLMTECVKKDLKCLIKSWHCGRLIGVCYYYNVIKVEMVLSLFKWFSVSQVSYIS